MSKRKGPFLITDLASKLGAASSPSRANKPAADTDHARNAYGFIAENYKAPPKAAEIPPLSSTAPCTSESGSNRVQIKAKSGSNRVQTQIQIGFKSGSEDPLPKLPIPKSGSESGSTLVQTGFKSGSNQVQSKTLASNAPDVLMARGDQRRILDYFFDLSVNSGDRATPPLSSAEIGIALQMPQESVRTALKRLLQRGAILRRGFQRGRSGWSYYELSQIAYRELLDFRKSGSNWVQNGFKSGSKSGSESGSTVSSSSSILEIENFKTTTSAQALQSDKFELGSAWLSVDFSSLAEIGFTETHLTQVASRGKLTPELLQSSIDAFAFDLKKNQKGKSISGSPLNFFMGIVGKGSVYAPPANYETQEDEALRKLVEAKAEQAAKRSALHQQLKDIEFDEWYQNLSEAEKVERAPLFQKEGDARKASIRSQWEQDVWPETSQSIPGILKQSREEVSRLIDQSLEEARR